MRRRAAHPDGVRIDDTICRQVSNREQHLAEFARRFDVVVFVCGRKSSNGKVLSEAVSYTHLERPRPDRLYAAGLFPVANDPVSYTHLFAYASVDRVGEMFDPGRIPGPGLSWQDGHPGENGESKCLYSR